MLTISETMDEQVKYAAHKVSMTRRPVAYLVQAALAGSYIGVAVVLMVSAAGGLLLDDSPWTKLVQGLVFGVALTLVFAAGGELATSNMMTLTQGVLRRTIGWRPALGTLAFSFVGNLVGAAIFASMVHASGVLAPETAAGKMIATMLEGKSHEASSQLFWRGVLCNMLVCLAMWSAMRLKSEGAQLFVIFWCLLAFITSGFEHVVANMTTFSLGVLGGLPGASLADFGHNLLFVGLGNLVGGAIVVGAAYAVIAGRPHDDASPAAHDVAADAAPASAVHEPLAATRS
ncbi:formate/nitrite transporter family protein [Pengzhenrongella sicca]|uniref:Formate/nitrite transporter family protein n=2 Tax=Pengzhenrongella sicca TaxID=2819238 RepID=A0A8A4ZEH1_9MICO|nr:formate/nitrite transporter family protein [Pengzhenrongella sicca]